MNPIKAGIDFGKVNLSKAREARKWTLKSNCLILTCTWAASSPRPLGSLGNVFQILSYISAEGAKKSVVKLISLLGVLRTNSLDHMYWRMNAI